MSAAFAASQAGSNGNTANGCACLGAVRAHAHTRLCLAKRNAACPTHPFQPSFADTAIAVMVCTYVGCCDASTTWLSMAGKASVPHTCHALSAFALCARPCRTPPTQPAAVLPTIVSTVLSYCAQAVPTALGGVWGLIVTMALPNFARCAPCYERAVQPATSTAVHRQLSTAAREMPTRLAQHACRSHACVAILSCRDR